MWQFSRQNPMWQFSENGPVNVIGANFEPLDLRAQEELGGKQGI